MIKYNSNDNVAQVSRYDKLSALLTTFVLFAGILVSLMLIVWFFFQIAGRGMAEPIAIQLYEDEDDDPEKKFTGVANQIQPPGVQEFPEIQKPQLKEMLEAMTDLPSKLMGEYEQLGRHNKSGPGIGPGREDEEEYVPWRPGDRPWERWTVEYSQDNIENYAQQLDYFGIQIGLVSQSMPRVDLLSGVSTNPTLKSTTRVRENRVFFTHRRATLMNWDRRLLRRAGVKDFEHRFVVQFIPNDLTKKLIALEINFAKQNSIALKKVQQTVFRVRQANGGYEFVVQSMN